MRIARLLIVVLLTALLPWRGVMAAAMACPGGPADAAAVVHVHGDHTMPHADGAEAAIDGHDHDRHHDVASMHADGALGTGHGTVSDDPAPSHAGSCHYCASGCCMASLPATMPALKSLPLESAPVFPALDVPAAAHPNAGLERPPRTS